MCKKTSSMFFWESNVHRPSGGPLHGACGMPGTGSALRGWGPVLLALVCACNQEVDLLSTGPAAGPGAAGYGFAPDPFAQGDSGPIPTDFDAVADAGADANLPWVTSCEDVVATRASFTSTALSNSCVFEGELCTNTLTNCVYQAASCVDTLMRLTSQQGGCGPLERSAHLCQQAEVIDCCIDLMLCGDDDAGPQKAVRVCAENCGILPTRPGLPTHTQCPGAGDAGTSPGELDLAPCVGEFACDSLGRPLRELSELDMQNTVYFCAMGVMQLVNLNMQ
jgi:hypothetical protein